MKKLADLPRRTVDELALRYELEPTMRDVFVEGPSDQAIVRWFIDAGCTDGPSIAVFQIDEVDVPRDLLEAHGLNVGNRSEVLGLCLELESRFGTALTGVTGIVDSDTSPIISGDPESGFILKSDFSCVEMYLFTENCLAKMLKLAFPNIKRPAKEVIDQLSPVLRECFLARAANESLGLQAKWVNLATFASVSDGNLVFRLEDFRRHYLQSVGATKRRVEFDAEIERLRAMLVADFRFAANGHDAIALLGLFLKGFCKKSKDGDKTCPHILVYFLTCSLEASDVEDFPMFQKLLKRVGKSNADSDTV